MEASKKYKWALTGFIIMLVLNILVLGSIWMVKKEGRSFDDDRAVQFRMQRFMERELDFSDEQKQAFEKLRRDHIQKTRNIYGDIRRNRQALYSELQGENRPDTSERMDSLTSQIGESQALLDAAVFEHFIQIRGMCTEVQKQKFDQIIEKVMQRLEPDQRRRNFN